MKTKLIYAFSLLFIAYITLLISCKKKEEVPVLTTVDISSITQTSASCGGSISSQGSSSILVKGVCWSTSIDPTTQDNKTADGPGSESFTSEIGSLSPKTTYFVRAYATNNSGTGYGSSKSFTSDPASLAEVTTLEVTSITQTSATSGGDVTSDGASPIIDRGVCWSTSQNPTTSDYIASGGTGIGTFSSAITNLTGNTIYYVRAYAINSIGTSYGNQQSFKTSPVLPALTLSSIASYTTNSGNINVSITSDGGTSITSKGVCFSTS